MKPLIVSLIFFYGCLGVILLYATLYMTHIMGGTPMQIVAWFTPMAVGGCILSAVGGLVLHLVPGTILVLFSGIAWIVAPLLFALMPVGGNYFAWLFPAMICATVGIDITFNVTNVFVSFHAICRLIHASSLTSLNRSPHNFRSGDKVWLVHSSIPSSISPSRCSWVSQMSSTRTLSKRRNPRSSRTVRFSGSMSLLLASAL